MKIDQILASFKKAKVVDLTNLKLLRHILNDQNIQRLTLWKMNAPTRFLMSMAKGQMILIALAGFTVFPYMMYQRYLSQPQKGAVIAIATPIVSLVMLAPLIYYRRFSAKMISEIWYDHKNKQFVLEGLKNNSSKRAFPQNIKYTSTHNNRIKEIQVSEAGKSSKHSIQGIGKWESLELFKYINEKNQL